MYVCRVAQCILLYYASWSGCKDWPHRVAPSTLTMIKEMAHHWQPSTQLARRPRPLAPQPADSVLGGSPHRDANTARTEQTEPAASRHPGESRLQAAQVIPALTMLLAAQPSQLEVSHVIPARLHNGAGYACAGLNNATGGPGTSAVQDGPAQHGPMPPRHHAT